MSMRTFGYTGLVSLVLLVAGCGAGIVDSGDGTGLDSTEDALRRHKQRSAVDAGVDAGATALPDSGAPAPAPAPTTPDAGTVVAPVAPDAGTVAPAPSRWLSTSGNKIVRADGTVWAGRGMNLPDTRGCDACAWNQPNVDEVKRRIDEAVDVWHAGFLRLDLESFATSGGRVSWQQVTQDAQYLADIKAIVDHVGTKPDVYILVSLWVDPTFSAVGWPTTATLDSWRLLATTFRDTPHVLFGLSNEPQANYDGSQDAACWTAMNTTAQAIREVEDFYGTPHHVIAVQGTRSWSRVLDYYVTHPITAGGGGNIAYETHVYDPTSTFQARFVGPSATLPVIIGEFGPVDWAGMALADCANLMQSADANRIPWLAWTFHMRCPPNLLEDTSGGSCGVGMTLRPTAWGQLVKDRLAVAAAP